MLWLLIGYLFLFIHRPFEVWPLLGDIRIEFLYMLCTGLVWIMTPNKRLLGNAMHLAVAFFAMAAVLCAFASSYSELCLDHIAPFLKFLVFYLMLVTTVQDEKSLRTLLLGFVMVVFLYTLHSYWEFLCGRYVSRMGIRRMVGVDVSRGDPNAFAATLILTLTFVPALWRTYTNKKIRYALGAFCALASFCVTQTGSRGGFVALLIWATVVIWQSPARKKLAWLAIPAAPLLFLALPSELQNRFETIVNPDVGPENARTSSEARIIGLTLGMDLWQTHPVTGIGPGAWRPFTGRALEAHNLYGQLMGEMGSLGIIAFGSIILAYLVSIWRIRGAYRKHPEWNHDFLHQVSSAIGLGLFMLLFEGNFGHNLFRYNWVLFGAFVSICQTCVEQREREPELETWDEDLVLDEFNGEQVSYTGLYS